MDIQTCSQYFLKFFVEEEKGAQMSVANWSHVIEASFDKAPFPMTIKRCVTSHNYLTKDYVDYQVVRLVRYDQINA